MKKYWFLILWSTLFFSFENFQFNLSKAAIKKMDKTLADLWQGKTITKKPINLSIENKKKLSFPLKNETFYQLIINTKTSAYLVLSKGKGKMNFFDYMIVYNLDLSILKVKLLVYREEYGGEIGSDRWLKQFTGKSNPNQMKFGNDIQNISGATISAQSINEDIIKVTKQLIELKEKGII